MTSETCEQDRTMNEHTIKMLKEELLKVKQSLTEYQRSEHLVSVFSESILRSGLDGRHNVCNGWAGTAFPSKIIEIVVQNCVCTERSRLQVFS